MVEVEEIQLNVIIPNNRVGIVVLQPFLRLSQQEPFRWEGDNKTKQLARIIRTLEIAKWTDHGCDKTYFTVFPEYSIPGLEGVRRIQEILEDDSWATGTIMIGGLDGLSKAEYSTLCHEDVTEVSRGNRPENILQAQWINCCITWVKNSDGSLKKWIQPKLVPSWPERNIVCADMFCGKSIYMFRCKFENHVDCHFLSLICFDWIGEIGTRKGISAVLHEINEKWRQSVRKDIHFVFLLQHNDEPNHHIFLENIRNYFEERNSYPFVVRDGCVIINVNTAGGDLPGKHPTHGFSSLICSPNAPYDKKSCPPTFSVRTAGLRGKDNLGRCNDGLFREMGACIHSCEFCIPSFINLGPPGRSLIISRAIVHAVDQGINDPRVPGNPVPASIKWVNDILDEVKSVLNYQANHPLRSMIERSHKEVSEKIRFCSDVFLSKSLKWGVCDYDKWVNPPDERIPDIDGWSDKERIGLETIVYSLTVLNVCKPLEFSATEPHAMIRSGANLIDVIIVSGGETSEKCFRYGTQFLTDLKRFGIVITRDIHDFPVNRRNRSILDVEGGITERGPIITDPSTRFVHCGYSNLRNACFDSTSLKDLNDRVTEIIGV